MKEMWRYYTRLDDIIIPSTGTNVNPLVEEGIIMSPADIVGALLTGANRPTA